MSESTRIGWATSLGVLLAIVGCDGTSGNSPTASSPTASPSMASSPTATFDGKKLTFRSLRVGSPGDPLGADLTVPADSKVVVVTAVGKAGLGFDAFEVFLADSSGAEVQISGESSEMTMGGPQSQTSEFFFIVPEAATGPYKIRLGDEASVDLGVLGPKGNP